MFKVQAKSLEYSIKNTTIYILLFFYTSFRHVTANNLAK